MPGYTREVKKFLAEASCRFERQGKGDHEIWFSPLTGIRSPSMGTPSHATPRTSSSSRQDWRKPSRLLHRRARAEPATKGRAHDTPEPGASRPAVDDLRRSPPGPPPHDQVPQQPHRPHHERREQPRRGTPTAPRTGRTRGGAPTPRSRPRPCRASAQSPRATGSPPRRARRAARVGRAPDRAPAGAAIHGEAITRWVTRSPPQPRPHPPRARAQPGRGPTVGSAVVGVWPAPARGGASPRVGVCQGGWPPYGHEPPAGAS